MPLSDTSPRKNYTLSLDKKVVEKAKLLADRAGLSLSRWLELLARKEIEQKEAKD